MSREFDAEDVAPIRLIQPASRPLRGPIELPGSKSLTQRAMVLAAMASGRSTISNALDADDPRRLLAAIEALGASIDGGRDGVLSIEGTGGVFDGGMTLDLGEGATGARFCLALACLAAAPVVVDGGPRLRERPMGEGTAMLRSLGAAIHDRAAPGLLPVEVVGGGLRGGTVVAGRTASSQFLSALLLVAPAMAEGLDLRLDLPDDEAPTSASYLWMTLETLRDAGVVVELDRALPQSDTPSPGPRRIRIAPQMVRPRAWSIEPDASTAIFFAVAAAIVPGSSVELSGLRFESRQPDAEAIRRLAEFGVEVRPGEGGVCVSAPERIVGAELDASRYPDAVPALAVLASEATSPTTIRGLGTLRIKESDRIAAIAENLHRAGTEVETGEDWIRIVPSDRRLVPHILIDPQRDHRIAMAFSLLGLVRTGLAIADPEVVAKSDPRFWDRLERLAGGGTDS